MIKISLVLLLSTVSADAQTVCPPGQFWGGISCLQFDNSGGWVGPGTIINGIIHVPDWHLIEYQGVIMHHDHMTKKNCEMLRDVINSTTKHMAECFE